MKIVTKLKIFGIFASLLIIALGFVTSWRASQVDLAFERDSIVHEMVKEAFTLNVLSNDYIQTHGERAKMQWKSQHTHLSKSISSYKVDDKKEKQVVDELIHSQKVILEHFILLDESIKAQEASIPTSTSSASQRPETAITTEEVLIAKELESRLSGQLSVDTQNIVSLASTLADINNVRLSNIRQTSYVFLMSVIVILGITLILTYFLLAKNISGNIKKLAEGTKVLAEGDLSFRYRLENRDEFGQLADAFNTMASKLEKLDEIKTEFIYLVSHELRTPIGAIKGLASMINEGDYGELSNKMERPLQLITTSTDRILHIVNNVLSVTRIQAGKISLIPDNYRVKDLINEVVLMTRPMFEQKGIRVDVDVLDTSVIFADKERVVEILNNLIDNAIKFTEKGNISIKSEQKEEKVIIKISDTGIGITKEDQKKLFDKFDEVKLTQAGKTTGIGLGLYISREFARKMMGDLWIEESEVGKGSTFALSLPAGLPKNNLS